MNNYQVCTEGSKEECTTKQEKVADHHDGCDGDRSTVETFLAENRNFQVCTTVEKEKCEEELERKLETKCTTVDVERCQQVRRETCRKVPFALSH